MSSIIVAKKQKNATNSPRDLFNRQRRKVEVLQQKFGAVTQECESALTSFHSTLKPKMKKVGDLLVGFVLEIERITNNREKLSADDKEVLHDLMSHDLSLLFELIPVKEIPDEIKSVYKDVFGHSYEENFKDSINGLEQILKEDYGIDDFDLSHLQASDDEDELIEKFMNSLKDILEKNEHIFEGHTENSKKNSKHEEKSKDLENLQQKNINTLYKRLAKELHPDLEQDPVKRSEKEILMKKLTAGYENGDLLELLKIESGLAENLENQVEIADKDTLKIYNHLLKEQIKNLESDISRICADPRYLEIYQYIAHHPTEPKVGIEKAILDLNDQERMIKEKLSDLQSSDPLKSLREILSVLKMRDLMSELVSFDDLFLKDISFQQIRNPHKKKKK